MTTMNVTDWLIEWFIKNSHIERSEIENNLSENYLSKGWIDSLKFITFVSDIESNFSISFSNDEFQNKSFPLIVGLAKIIQKKIK